MREKGLMSTGEGREPERRTGLTFQTQVVLGKSSKPGYSYGQLFESEFLQKAEAETKTGL